MKFSSQEEYGLRCLLQLARIGQSNSMTITEISRAEGLTTTHIAKLLMILRKEGFVTSIRGQTGGYSIARSPSDMSLRLILEALGGKLFDQEFCTKHAGNSNICAHDMECTVRSLWQNLQTKIDSVLDQMTLADLVQPSSLDLKLSTKRKSLSQLPMTSRVLIHD